MPRTAPPFPFIGDAIEIRQYQTSASLGVLSVSKSGCIEVRIVTYAQEWHDMMRANFEIQQYQRSDCHQSVIHLLSPNGVIETRQQQKTNCHLSASKIPGNFSAASKSGNIKNRIATVTFRLPAHQSK